MVTSPKDKLHSQDIYQYNDEALMAEQSKCAENIFEFNQLRPSNHAERDRLMTLIFGSVGNNCFLEGPLRANWGIHTHLGDNFYANFTLTLVDDTHIRIGNNVMCGPNVTLTTAGHPIDPTIRLKATQFNMPITIEDNVWLGAHVVVLPGVRIGENSVIGAGSVVTKDIPSNVVAVGSPCQVLRDIDDHDKTYFYKDKMYDAKWKNEGI